MSAFQAAYALSVVLAVCVVGLLKHAENLRAQRDQANHDLDIAQIVCDTLAYDLAEALHIGGTPVAGSDTPVHDGVVLDFFRRQLERGQQA